MIFSVYVPMPPGDLAVNKRMTGDKGAVYRQAIGVLKRELRAAADEQRLPTPIETALRLTISHEEHGLWLTLESIEEVDVDRTIDVDAPVKAIMDAFEKSRVIVDDVQIDELVVRRKGVDRAGRVQ